MAPGIKSKSLVVISFVEEQMKDAKPNSEESLISHSDPLQHDAEFVIPE